MRQNAAHRRRTAAFSASPTKTFLRPSTSHLSLLLLLLSFIFVFVFGWARVEAFPFGGGEQLRRFRKALNNNDSADELDHPSSITRVSEPPPTTDHLITEVAFDLGRRYTGPKYAFITSGSYKRFVHEMKEKCRTTTDGNIAEIRLNTFDYDYFRWEELEFNKALVRTLFPETVKRRDYGRFMNASRSIRQIRLDELENRCLQKARDEDWDAVLDEKTRFEDFLINTIFQPRYPDEQAREIIERIEGGGHEYAEDAESGGGVERHANASQPTRIRRSALAHERELKNRVRTRIRTYQAKGGF